MPMDILNVVFPVELLNKPVSGSLTFFGIITLQGRFTFYITFDPILLLNTFVLSLK